MPRAQREELILDAAQAEFGLRGYAHASVPAVAAAAGVSKPLVYAYFGSRADLYAACVAQVGERLVAAVRAAQGSGDAGSRALATLEALFVALDGRPYVWNILYDNTIRRDDAVWEIARPYREQLDDMGHEGVVAVLAPTSATPHDADASLLRALWFSAVTTVISWWSDHPDESPAEMTERCRRVFGALLRRS